MRRVPGVHVLSMEPRSLGVAGASFIRRKKKKLPGLYATSRQHSSLTLPEERLCFLSRHLQCFDTASD